MDNQLVTTLAGISQLVRWPKHDISGISRLPGLLGCIAEKKKKGRHYLIARQIILQKNRRMVINIVAENAYQYLNLFMKRSHMYSQNCYFNFFLR